ncbi:MAG: hypothetical protein ABI925_08820 [Verrucomicrobiota bacterium]
MDELEDLSQRSLHYARDQFDAVVSQTEDYVREKPTQSLLYAFLFGFIVNRLPIGRLIVGVLRLALFAFKPAVLIYGARRLYRASQDEE